MSPCQMLVVPLKAHCSARSPSPSPAWQACMELPGCQHPQAGHQLHFRVHTHMGHLYLQGALLFHLLSGGKLRCQGRHAASSKAAPPAVKQLVGLQNGSGLLPTVQEGSHVRSWHMPLLPLSVATAALPPIPLFLSRRVERLWCAQWWAPCPVLLLK